MKSLILALALFSSGSAFATTMVYEGGLDHNSGNDSVERIKLNLFDTAKTKCENDYHKRCGVTSFESYGKFPDQYIIKATAEPIADQY